MSKPTAGPWEVFGPDKAPNPNIGLWSVEGYTNVANDCTLADAHLIAAAPEMLEALELVVGSLSFDREDAASKEVMRRVNAAVAKAKRLAS